MHALVYKLNLVSFAYKRIDLETSYKESRFRFRVFMAMNNVGLNNVCILQVASQ